MAQQTLARLAEFAFAQAQIRARGEGVPIAEIEAAAEHLNDILVDWGAMSMVVPGFSRQAFPVAERRPLFTVGPGGDLPTATAVTGISSVWIRFMGGAQFMPTRVEASKVLPVDYTRGHRGWAVDSYAVLFDRDFVRLLFPGSLDPGDYIVLDYTTELGEVLLPLREGDPDNIRVSMPNLHLQCLRYGMAVRLAREQGSPKGAELAMRYQGLMGSILNRNNAVRWKRYDTATLSRNGLWFAESSFGGDIIGGVYQGDGSVVINPDHPDHPDYTDGEAVWGTVAGGVDTETGRFGYRNATGFVAGFPAPGDGVTRFYIDVPMGAAITLIEDESGFRTQGTWTRTGQRWTLGPFRAAAFTQARRYIVTIDAE